MIWGYFWGYLINPYEKEIILINGFLMCILFLLSQNKGDFDLNVLSFLRDSITNNCRYA